MRFTYNPGDRPLEGYTIKGGLGRGGFGEVYHAVSDGGKEVALKLVQRNLEVELRGVAQCLNLKHANLVIVYDVRQVDGGDNWVVMEHVKGETLDKLIGRYPQGMPPDMMLTWLKGICEGVAYLHEQGIVHRDLKPGNLFMEDGVVKIGDYGLSKFISASRRSGQTGSVGTVHYMAPEIVKGKYGKEVDLYAVGIMLYEMLTGRVPFEGESPGEILMKHLTAWPDLNVIELPYRGVVARLLDKDPARRYSSAGLMFAELQGEMPSAAGRVAAAQNYAGAPIAAFALAECAKAEEPKWSPFYRGQVNYAAPAGTARPNIWESFLKEDPIIRWLREQGQKLSASTPSHVLLAAAFVGGILVIWPVTLAIFAYWGAALFLRWCKSTMQDGTATTAAAAAAAPADQAAAGIPPLRPLTPLPPYSPLPEPERAYERPPRVQAFALDMRPSDVSRSERPSGLPLLWCLPTAIFLAVGVGLLIGAETYRDWGDWRGGGWRNNFGEAMAFAVGVGWLVFGGALLLLLLFQRGLGKPGLQFGFWRFLIALGAGLGVGLLVGADRYRQDNFGQAMATGVGFGMLAGGGSLLILSALNRLLGHWSRRDKPERAGERDRPRSSGFASAMGKIAVALVVGAGVAFAMTGIFALDKDNAITTAALIGVGFGLGAFGIVCWSLFQPEKPEPAKPEPLTRETPISASGVSAAQLGETGPWHVVEEKR